MTSKIKRKAWNGLSQAERPTVWRLLFGICRKETQLTKKRLLYFAMQQEAACFELEEMSQIALDVARTQQQSSTFQQQCTKERLVRILGLWAFRHPVCGYVQGMNDIIAPIYAALHGESTASKDDVEADAFWCFDALLQKQQDCYSRGQPGIAKKVRLLGQLLLQVDPQLASHLEAIGLEVEQAAFRWMACLLAREFTLDGVMRLWDAYLAKGLSSFDKLHVHVCLALLLRNREQICNFKDYGECLIFLQALPPLPLIEIGLLMSEAVQLASKISFAVNNG